MDENTLPPDQERQWRELLKVIGCFYRIYSPLEENVWKRFHFGLPLPPRQSYTREAHELVPLLLKPLLSDAELDAAIRAIRIEARGARAGTWIEDLNNVFKKTGYEIFSGRTERIMELLLEGKAERQEEWFRHN